MRGELYYETASDAVNAAFDEYIHKSINNDVEYGGVIYKDDKGYFYTWAMGLGESGMLAYTPQSFDADVISMWHTHGDSDSGFSGQDLAIADRICIKSYMMNNTNRIFTYKGCSQ